MIIKRLKDRKTTQDSGILQLLELKYNLHLSSKSRKDRGLIYANIELFNFADETLCEEGYLTGKDIRTVQVRAMADSGAIRLSINENIRARLGLRVSSRMHTTLADGTVKEFDIAGPIKVKFKGRDCITDAFVLPCNEEVLLGAIPMEAMDLAIVPKTESLEFNPDHPDGPKYSLRRMLKRNYLTHPSYIPTCKTQPVS